MLLTPVPLFTMLTTPQILDTHFVKNKAKVKANKLQSSKSGKQFSPEMEQVLCTSCGFRMICVMMLCQSICTGRKCIAFNCIASICSFLISCASGIVCVLIYKNFLPSPKICLIKPSWKLAKFLQLFLENYIPYIPDKDNVK